MKDKEVSNKSTAKQQQENVYQQHKRNSHIKFLWFSENLKMKTKYFKHQ